MNNTGILLVLGLGALWLLLKKLTQVTFENALPVDAGEAAETVIQEPFYSRYGVSEIEYLTMTQDKKNQYNAMKTAL